MKYCQSRVAMLLALPPLVVAMFCMGDVISKITKIVWPGPDSLQIAALAATLVFCGIWWAIWGQQLNRDAPRLTATLTIAAFVIGQVLFWQPMWHSSGCADDDVLRCAQSLTDLGLGCLGFALTWWSGHRWREIRRQSVSFASTNVKGRQSMSLGTVRLAVGFALMPLLPGVFFVVFQALHQFLSLTEAEEFAIGYGACAILAVVVWWLVWRRAVNWTATRKTGTGLLIAMMLAAPLTTLIHRVGIDWLDTLIMLLPLFVLAVWFAGTAWVWRLQPGEWPADQHTLTGMSPSPNLNGPIPVPCGNCDYDLRGLREARCPECGWTTTLDALIQRSLAASLATGD